MRQYLAIKAAHPDHLVFYRMGDFYELFFDDAVKAAAALDIALTKRGQHRGEDIPMGGVPVHSHEAYLARLIRAGFKVAVCEQVEDLAEAKKRGAKSVVKRDVVRGHHAGHPDRGRRCSMRAATTTSAPWPRRRASWRWPGSISRPATSPPSRSLPAGIAAALARLAPGELLVPDRLLARDACQDRAGGLERRA